MSEPLTIQLNGQPRTFTELPTPTPLSRLIQALGLKPDRIAVEHNGEIAPRSTWPTLEIQPHDRLEIVHFVGGGAPASSPAAQPKWPPARRLKLH